MAVITNTFTTASSKRNRETFSDIISRITPEETPFFSMLDDESNLVDGTHPEWSTDTIRAPVLTNAQLEGDQYTFNAITATVRVGNYTQISREGYVVSRTQEEVSKAGPRSELGKERARAGLALRHDIEVSMLSNNASVAGATRKSAGMRAWLATNDMLGASGASGGFNAGTGVVDAATDGTQRSFTKGLMDDAIEAVYGAGGSPSIIMMSPYAKRVFSSFMADAGVAGQRVQTSKTEQATIVGAADAYLSDFGLLSVVPNRQMIRHTATNLARNIFLIDPDKVAKGFLHPIAEDKEHLASNADATTKMLICEWTLIVKNEAAHGVIADVFGKTAST